MTGSDGIWALRLYIFDGFNGQAPFSSFAPVNSRLAPFFKVIFHRNFTALHVPFILVL